MQVTNSTAVKIQQALQPVQNAANQVNTAMYNAMAGGDTYQANALPAQPQKVSMRQLVDDNMRPPHPIDFKIANRLSWIGINDSESFLKVANTPFKRTLISYLGAGLFLNSQDRQHANYQIAAWTGQADLMRAGADLPTARLLQVSGAGDSAMLARYRNPIDKGVLYAAMSANALQYGYWMPPFQQVSQMIDRAGSTPPSVRW